MREGDDHSHELTSVERWIERRANRLLGDAPGGGIHAKLVEFLVFGARLETGRELWVIVLFHLVGTGMEVFKTGVGSWEYGAGGILHVGGVPLYTGFMYAAVGSYLVRVYRLFDLRFVRYPRRWITAIIAVCIYVNFFAQHYTVDFRWVLLAAVLGVYARTIMHFRVFRGTHRMPVVVAFLLVVLVTWVYPPRGLRQEKQAFTRAANASRSSRRAA